MRIWRDFTKDQINGRHHITIIPPELNKEFLKECKKQRRIPSDMIRIMLEDRYCSEVIKKYPI